MIKRIHAHYQLAGEALDLEAVERAHRSHADKCPVARSIRGSIDVTTSYEIV